jgi:hypothetical protein
MTMLSRLRAEIEIGELTRCVLVLLPTVLVALVTGDEAWWGAGIATISSFVAMERSGLAPLGVVLHGVAMTVGFLVLLAALPVTPLFVLGATALAVGAVWLTAAGAKLRFLGLFTFIPAVYIACETAEAAPAGAAFQAGLAFVPILAVALVPVLLLSAVTHHQTRNAGTRYARHISRVMRWAEWGSRDRTAESMVAVALAVAAAAWLVKAQHLPHGQWVIWSAASIVTGNAATGRRKARDRMAGAIVGVPVGIVLDLLVPHNAVTYGLTTTASLLTIVAFRRYVLGFGLRCAGAALALMLVGQTSAVAAERAGNVILGGLIGLLFVSLVQAAAKAWTGRALVQPP